VVIDTRALACFLLVAFSYARVNAQTISAEIDLTAGYSGEEVRTTASQIRVFGEAPARVNFFLDTTWGDRWAGDARINNDVPFESDPIGTDVFGAAYPYGGRVNLMEAYAERLFRPHGALLGVRAGKFRTPFGIYNHSDYSYTGFVRPPLVRYDGYWAFSNNWLEKGVMLTAGVPQLLIEASLGRPDDAGSARRKKGTDESIRIQGYRGQFIVGVSHARSNPYMRRRLVSGRQAFTGIDARWTHSSGIQARGEVMRGRSWDGVSTRGAYVDGYVHRPGMGPFTAVIRGEFLDYDTAPPRARFGRRVTLGTRVRWPGPMTLQLNYLHQHGDLPYIKKYSLDFSATYSLRLDHQFARSRDREHIDGSLAHKITN
jgi:hypothetical protein